MSAAQLKPSIKAVIDEMKNEAKNQLEKEEKEKEKEKMLGKKRNMSEKTSSSGSDEYDQFLYKPKIKLSDLGGMKEIVSQIRSYTGEVINLFDICKKIHVEPTKGILLCGPPGCGK